MRRPRLLGLLLAVWIGAQFILPLVRKVDFAPLRFRPETFSWSMFTRPSLRYEVELFRLDPEGGKRPIPEVGRFVRGLRSPEPVPLVDPNYGALRVQRRLARLIAHVAGESGERETYVVVMRWSEPGDDARREWRHQVERHPVASAG